MGWVVELQKISRPLLGFLLCIFLFLRLHRWYLVFFCFEFSVLFFWFSVFFFSIPNPVLLRLSASSFLFLRHIPYTWLS
jgi:hypothetical protein